MKHSTPYIILAITIQIVEVLIILLAALHSIPFAVMLYVLAVVITERLLKLASKKLEIKIWRQIE